MLSIGELAQRTGTSRRMLRHWEQVGLLAPALVDAGTGYRRYALSQSGRVATIAALREAGFGLEAIAALLDAELSHQQLVALLEAHQAHLHTQARQVSTRLAQVRQRLDSLEEGHETIMTTLTLGPLPALRLSALRVRVGDESEIAAATEQLRGALARALPALEAGGVEVVLVYDGVSEQDAIWVGAGVHARDVEPEGALGLVSVAGAEQAATIRYQAAPPSIGDAWIGLDAHLEERALRAHGVYRQVLTPGGQVLLQAPVLAAA